MSLTINKREKFTPEINKQLLLAYRVERDYLKRALLCYILRAVENLSDNGRDKNMQRNKMLPSFK